MICNLYIFLNTCTLLQSVRFVCSEFHNFTPYIEMHIDFMLVWARWTLNVYLCRVSYFCTCRLNIFCKLPGSSLWYALNIIIDVLNLTKSINFKMCCGRFSDQRMTDGIYMKTCVVLASAKSDPHVCSKDMASRAWNCRWRYRQHRYPQCVPSR